MSTRKDLGDAYLPDDAEKGRSVRESGKGVLEMPVREANRLGASLVEATGIRRASALEERVLIDGIEWTGASGIERSLEDTRYRWLPAHRCWRSRRTADRARRVPRRRVGPPRSAGSAARL